MHRRSEKRGLPPGTLVHVGEETTDRVRVTTIDYDAEQCEEKEIRSIEECFPCKDRSTVTWINLDGIHQVDLIRKIGRHFELHPLTSEDIVSTEQRPKVEDYGHYLFLVLKMLYYDNDDRTVKSEQISLVLTDTCVISFQERRGDVFDLIRERIRANKGRIRAMGADYLAYVLIDALVDNCFAIMETIGERVELIEDHLMTDPSPETLQSIHNLKREIILMRKAVWPLREVVSTLLRQESPLVKQATGVYFRDVYDHTIQVIDTIESFRDIVSSIVDIYLSSASNRMNEVMKVLTIIATIFIPLTFITGVYGMNFDHMPERQWRAAYPAVCIVMVLIAVGMLVYFRRKRWL